VLVQFSQMPISLGNLKLEIIRQFESKLYVNSNNNWSNPRSTRGARFNYLK